MKKTFYLLIIFSLLTGMIKLYAQEEEATTQFLLSEKTVFSGFGSPFVEFSSINDEFAVCAGGGGALMIDQTLFIGGYFEGLTTNHYMNDMKTIVGIEKPKVSFEHGGFWLGYVYKHKKAIHGGLSMKLGWGEIDLDGDDDDDGEDDPDSKFADNIFAISPQVEMELNLAAWFKINIGVGYRFVTGINATYLDDSNNHVKLYNTNDFASPIGTISLLFGGFTKKE